MAEILTVDNLDDYFKTTPIGSVSRAIGNNLYGINHMQIPGMVPSNKDTYGLTFFMRPQLNLQADNLRNVRKMYPLLTEDVQSIPRLVRMTLDPRLAVGYSVKGKEGYTKIPPLKCPVVDPMQCFIPILSNNLNTISGWPDITGPTYTSDAGLVKEMHSMFDGSCEINETVDLDCNFRNTRGDPIVFMIATWILYGCKVTTGLMSPYLDFISENEIDYNTCIYRLVLDQNRNEVTKIARSGPGIPVSIAMGSFFDFNNEKPYNDQNKDITIRFKVDGVTYNDDILVYEFNASVCIFNPSMKDDRRANDMFKLTKNIKGMFNNRGYPRINPNTYELEWWVFKEHFQDRTTEFLESNLTNLEKQDLDNTES